MLLCIGVLSACGNESASGNGEVGFPDWWNQRDANVDPSTDAGGDATVGADTEPDAGEETITFPGSDDGEPCTEDAECLGGTCLPDSEWPDGYCTARPCNVDDDCSALDVVCSAYEGESLCALTCRNDDGCRDGYWCAPAQGRDENICIPGERPEPTGAIDGEPCELDEDCAGGTCIEDPEWPNGYCTTLACNTFADCARGPDDVNNRCLIQQPTNFCVRICSSPADCRAEEGYICQPVGGGQGICVPGVTSPPTREIDLDDYPFPVECGVANERGTVTIDYTIDEGTTSYMITPLAKDGARVQPLRIELPDGETIDMRGANAFQLTPSILFGFINPIIVPAVASDASQVQAGDHRLVIETATSDLCWYLLQESEPGNTIDLNVYLVGIPGVTAETAPDDPSFTTVFEAFESIYEPAGVTIGELRFIDPEESVVEAYQIVRSQTDVEQLVSQTDRPGETVDDALSLNVFFVRAFAFSGGSGVLGISMGLPGAAGVHGTRSSGVAFTTEFMGGNIPGEGDGNEYTGVVLAHEVGHYLGLFHTSEQGGAGFDPLDDTPECRRNFPAGCPDLNNLMFPLAGISHTEVSEDQAWQIQVNPLTKR